MGIRVWAMFHENSTRPGGMDHVCVCMYVCRVLYIAGAFWASWASWASWAFVRINSVCSCLNSYKTPGAHRLNRCELARFNVALACSGILQIFCICATGKPLSIRDQPEESIRSKRRWTDEAGNWWCVPAALGMPEGLPSLS